MLGNVSIHHIKLYQCHKSNKTLLFQQMEFPHPFVDDSIIFLHHLSYRILSNLFSCHHCWCKFYWSIINHILILICKFEQKSIGLCSIIHIREIIFHPFDRLSQQFFFRPLVLMKTYLTWVIRDRTPTNFLHKFIIL